MNYKDLKTFEDCLKIKGETVEDFNLRTYGLEADTIGYEKVKIIVFAVNGGKNVDRGYYPWFYNPSRSVSGFSFTHCRYDDGYSSVGACLLLESSTKAIYAGKTFLNEYSEYING